MNGYGGLDYILLFAKLQLHLLYGYMGNIFIYYIYLYNFCNFDILIY